MGYKVYEVKIFDNGTKEWRRDNNLHRDDGPAVEMHDGTKKWFLKGLLHRDDGPAVEGIDGTREWCLMGKLHREDGPAIMYPDGTTYHYLNDKYYSEQAFKKEMSRRNNSCDGKVVEIEGKKYKLTEVADQEERNKAFEAAMDGL